MTSRLLRRWLGVHEHEGVWWFRKEPFEAWVGWMFFVQVVEALAAGEDENAWVQETMRLYRGTRVLLKRAEEVGWRWEEMDEVIRGSLAPGSPEQGGSLQACVNARTVSSPQC